MIASHRLSARSLAAMLPAITELPTPRYRSLAAAIEALLLDGRIAPGAALPSERDLAGALGVSRSTTTAVYERLGTDGLLVARRGSGSFLQLPAGSRISGPGGRLNRHGAAGEVIDLSIAALPAAPGLLQTAAANALPQLAKFTSGIGYQPYGITRLRELVAGRYADRGVPTSPDQILVTNGAQHGLDLILRLLLSPGERVLTELPSYPGALDAVQAHGGRVLAIPFSDDGGWDVAAMSSTLQQSSPRLALLIPDFNNPTGTLIGSEQRRQVVAAARRAGTRVVADESFVELDLTTTDEAAEPPVPMAALSPEVFSVGSMSKPVWGGLRAGWIRADAESITRLAIVRARADMSGSVLDQLLACELLAAYPQIITERRAQLRAGREALLTALAEQLPGWRPSRPAGGLSTWIRLDAPASSALTHQAEQRGVLLTPGSRFTVEASLERYLRIPFALAPAVLTDAVGRIAQAWAELDEQPVRRFEAGLLMPT